jgi:uncharacterized protein YciI
MDEQSVKLANAKRRGFLMAAGAGSAAAVGAVAVSSIPAAKKIAKAAPAKVAGYQESAHIRDYYATARI